MVKCASNMPWHNSWEWSCFYPSRPTFGFQLIHVSILLMEYEIDMSWMFDVVIFTFGILHTWIRVFLKNTLQWRRIWSFKEMIFHCFYLTNIDLLFKANVQYLCLRESLFAINSCRNFNQWLKCWLRGSSS